MESPQKLAWLVPLLHTSRIRLLTIYWIGWVIFFGFLWGTFDNNFIKTFSIQLIELPIKVIFVWLGLSWLIPSYFLERRYLDFFWLYVLVLMVASVIERILGFFFIDPLYFPERINYGFFKLTEITNVALMINTSALIPYGVKFFRHWFDNQQRALRLEKEKLEAELNFLKTQLNPHFLFNTLNNLYALILKKSDLAQEAVLKLSDLMRYLLYESNTPKVLLSQEIGYMRSYIDLEKLRLKENVEVSFSTSYQHDILVPPLLLLPFIENCFKHGISLHDQNSWITIQINVKDKWLIGKFANSQMSNTARNQQASGVGLANVRRRLDLLYADRYELRTEADGMSFLVILKLQVE